MRLDLASGPLDLGRRMLGSVEACAATLYARAGGYRVLGLRGEVVLHFVVLNVLLCLPYVVFAKYRSGVLAAIAAALGMDVGASEVGYLVDVSKLHVVAHATFVATFFLPASWRRPAAAAVFVTAGLGARLFDVASLVLIGLFALVVYRVAGWARGRRVSPFLLLFVPYLILLNGCHWLQVSVGEMGRLVSDDPAVAEATQFAAAFLPVVWYAAYEVRARRLGGSGTLAYLTSRLLTAPVFVPRRAVAEEAQVRSWQWRGVYALTMAFLSKSVSTYLYQELNAVGADWHLSSGFRLLGVAYLYYYASCFSLVANFNLFVGWARLFGFPAPDVFGLWLLARTPNERWQRWNLPFREWIMTTVFYPLMRARRGLFLAVMATMLASGGVHLLGTLTPDRFEWTRCLQLVVYWGINGLAIFLIIGVPRWFPSLVRRLGLSGNPAWAGLGIVLTTTFYSVLYLVRERCDSLVEMRDLFLRLFGG